MTTVSRLATLLIVIAGIGATRSAAGERDPGGGALPAVPGLYTPPPPLQDPLVPVLPGVVGPTIDAVKGSASRGAPSAQTTEHAAEVQSRPAGGEPLKAIDDDGIRQRLAIGIGLVGIIGIVAVLLAFRGASRRSEPSAGASFLRRSPASAHHPLEAGRTRARGPGAEPISARLTGRSP